jgi:hypothetical protein
MASSTVVAGSASAVRRLLSAPLFRSCGLRQHFAGRLADVVHRVGGVKGHDTRVRGSCSRLSHQGSSNAKLSVQLRLRRHLPAWRQHGCQRIRRAAPGQRSRGMGQRSGSLA